MSWGEVTIVAALTSALSFFSGLWGATYLQDREVRRRHLGLVRALQAELRRIRVELGGQGKAFIQVGLMGGKAVVPQLSPWVQNVLSDLASTNGTLIYRFLELDRYLTNLRSADTSMVAAQALVAAKQTDHEALTEGSGIVEVIVAENAVETAKEKVGLAEFMVQTDYRYAISALDDLQTGLGVVDAELSAALKTHLPWSRR